MLLKRRGDIEKLLSAPPKTLIAAVICGRDGGMVRERADRLAALAAPNADEAFDIARLTEGDLDANPGALEGELAAQSMLGGRRLVRLRMGEKAATLKLAEEALTEHLAGRTNSDAFLLIEAGDLKPSQGLLKAAERADACAGIICYEDDAADLERLTREALAAEKLSLNRDALELFAARLPKERGVARAEIERLILFLGPGSGRTASAADLVDFLGVEPEASLNDAALDAFGGRIAAAQSGLRRAAEEGEHGASAVARVERPCGAASQDPGAAKRPDGPTI